MEDDLDSWSGSAKKPAKAIFVSEAARCHARVTTTNFILQLRAFRRQRTKHSELVSVFQACDARNFANQGGTECTLTIVFITLCVVRCLGLLHK